MVHAFTYKYKEKQYSFLWDSESGSLLNVDTAAFLVAKNKYKYEELTQEEKNSFNNLTNSQILEISKELDELEEQGLINTKETTNIKSKPFGRIKAMCLLICQDCNMRCKYCFAKDGSYCGTKSFMSEEIAKKSVDFLIEKSGSLKTLEIDFFGGEPLLNLKVVKNTVKYAREREKETGKKFHFTLTTNCLALSDSVIDFLNKEMNNVVLSIDGRKEIHDQIRRTSNNHETHDIVLKNAMNFKSKRGNKSYYVRGTYTAKNLDFSNDVLFLNDKGFDQISMEPVVTEIDDLEIKKEHLEIIKNEYEKLAFEYIERRKNKNTWFNFFHFYLDLSHGPCLIKRLTGCGAGCDYISVDTNGDIYPCHQFTSKLDYKMGNVLDKNFNLEISKKMSCNVVTNKSVCESCFAKYYCSGGCAANNINFTNNMNKPYSMTCEMMKKRFELALFINAIENSIQE